MMTAPSVKAHSQDVKIRALFVLKFIENVTWPDEKKNVVIGVLGKSEILPEIQNRLQQRNPNGLTIKKITGAEAATCDVIYIPGSEHHLIQQIGASSSVTLIISETDMSRKGSGISFIEEGGRLTFLINKASIESRGLKISSSLLSLGKQV